MYKINTYLNSWKNKYWEGESMDNFLCNLLGNIRSNRTTVIKQSLHSINPNLPKELQYHVLSFIPYKRGGKYKIINKIHKYIRKYKTNKKSKNRRKSKSIRKHNI
jgi:hypothetical protein